MMSSTSTRRRWLGLAMMAALVAPSSSALAAGSAEQYVIELRVIEGERASPGERAAAPVVDNRLSPLAKDLANLPFKRFVLKDAHTSVVQEGDRVSLEIPSDTGGKARSKPRFLVVSAHGRQSGGKLRFSLGIEAVKFDTLVAVPDGGTIIVGGPRGTNGKVVLFAFTAKAKKS